MRSEKAIRARRVLLQFQLEEKEKETKAVVTYIYIYIYIKPTARLMMEKK